MADRNKIAGKKHTGIAIALAWPQTYCKQPGAWYDPLTLFLGINKNNYYKVGHAAVVLVDAKNVVAHYFDFGRYHAPFKHARVRSAETDDDLKLNTTPALSDNASGLKNFPDFLMELQQNASCHGEGKLFASYCPINFERAIAKAKQLQEKSPLPYGPFVPNGSNCSRFVNTVIRAGKPAFRHWFGLNFKIPFTPTPMSNVHALDNKQVLPKLLKKKPFNPAKKLEKQLLLYTLPAPERHLDIPENAQWLSGEGAGSWFGFEDKDNALLQVTRHSPEGTIECTGLYEKKGNHTFNTRATFTITHPSHCKMISLLVSGAAVRLYRVG